MTTAFISSEDLAAYLRDDNVDSALASIALDASCERVRGYCGQDFGVASVVDEWHDGMGTGRLMLNAFPVSAVSAVTAYTDRTDTSPEVLVLNTDYVVRSRPGIVMRIDGLAFCEGYQNVKVSYDYGYATVPSDIRLVALQVAARIYGVGMVVNESAGGVSETYVTGAGNLTRDEKDILRRYKVD